MKLSITLAAAVLLTTPTFSAPCRDAKGHFAKCPPTAAGATNVTKDSKGRCHAAGGKFVACPK